MKYPVRHVLEHALLRAVATVIKVLPYRVALGIGCLLGDLGFAILKRVRRRGLRRVQQVFGGRLTEAERHRIVREAFRNLTLNAVEALRVSKVDAVFVRQMVDASQVERIHTLMKAQAGRGVVIALPHMGNWELAGIVARHLGILITTVMRRQKNLLTDAYLNEIRRKAGLEVLPADAGSSFRQLVHRLKGGRCVAILPDLRAKGRNVRVSFLNHFAELPVGPAFFAREAQVALVPVCMFRENLAHHRILVFDPILPDLTAARDADLERMMRELMRTLDAAIQANPEQYFWFNKRWVLGEELTGGPA